MCTGNWRLGTGDWELDTGHCPQRDKHRTLDTGHWALDSGQWSERAELPLLHFDGGAVKLGDFGISRVLGATGDLAATAVGTPCYMAPELLDERPYDYKADVWSAGCVLFELLNLKRAFEARSMPALVRLVMRGRGAGFPCLDATYTSELRRLFAKLLSPKPRDRPDIVEILRAPIVVTACDRVRDGYSGESSPPSQPVVPEEELRQREPALAPAWIPEEHKVGRAR